VIILSTPLRHPEKRVILELTKGKDYEAIGESLNLKRSTVKRLFTGIMKKTNMNLIELAVHGLTLTEGIENVKAREVSS
jgi:DNA-binding NarL/FixJ family response regulator